MLQEVLPAGIFAFLLVFTRVGAALMLLPGFGEAFVSPRIRLMIALAVSLVLLPVIAAGLPGLPANPAQLFVLLAGETGIGVFIGGAARLTLSALHVAGTVMAFQSGLGMALFYDPNQGQQGALLATMMTLLGTMVIFATDLHLLLLGAVRDSYILFPPAALPPLGGFAEIAVRFIANSFLLGLQIATPIIVYGLVFYIGLGLLARLMPQLQVFFIAVPVQITLAFVLIGVSLAASMLWFADHFESSTVAFLARS